MNSKQLKELQSKIKSDNLSAEEKQALHRAYNEYLKSSSLDDFDESLAASKMEKFQIQHVFRNKRVRVLYTWRWAVGIAAVGLVFFVTYISLRKTHQPDVNYASEVAEANNKIPTIRNEAVAILPNGEEVILNNAGFNTLEESGALSGVELADQFITLKTPRGGRLNFMLPDGSLVWLNAETTLIYPVSFGRKSRRVEIEGEAYFEVVKSKSGNQSVPFIVDAGAQQVNVLGTKFNVNNYTGEKVQTTTLIEGSVQVTGNGKVSLLVPNQQYIQRAGHAKIVSVDVQDFVGWKDGVIRLNRQDFPTIARTIERNFNVRFADKNLSKHVELNGELLTNVNIDELLAGLGATMGVRFSRAGKNISVHTEQ